MISLLSHSHHYYYYEAIPYNFTLYGTVCVLYVLVIKKYLPSTFNFQFEDVQQASIATSKSKSNIVAIITDVVISQKKVYRLSGFKL